MGEIVANPERIAAFTSSEIHRLTGFDRAGKAPGKPFETYVKEKRYELRMKRSIDTGASSMTTKWGEFMERRAFMLIGLEHSLQSKTTLVHPEISNWAGSPDLVADEKVGDIKCYWPANFAPFYEVLESQSADLFKEEYPKEYWQLVSNACIAQKQKAEAVLYMPYQSEAIEIYKMVLENEEDMFRYKFIADMIEAEKYYELPFLPNDSGYNNLMTFEFEVPREDVEFLTERVKLAVEQLTLIQ